MNKKNNGLLQDIKFSVLDLVPVLANGNPGTAFKNAVDLARHCEALGFHRFWISEHHNMESVASPATVLLLGHIASNTSKIRIGSGGIMLPNHAPLMIAEQFGTLETLYPGRVDLGLGRAPGTDPRTAAALRRGRVETVEDFPRDIQELRTYFSKENKHAAVRALPGEGLEIPIFLLGSSTFSARLAAMLGLGYAFASHFAPAHLHEALQIYREEFRPSAALEKPYIIAGVNVVGAESDEEADYLATSQKLFALSILRDERKPLPPPVEHMEGRWSIAEQAAVSRMQTYNFSGSKESLETKLADFVAETGVDEILAVSHIYDPEKRRRSYEILSQLKDQAKDPFFDTQPPKDQL